MARIPVTMQGSSPGASRELTMPFILPGAAEQHRALVRQRVGVRYDAWTGRLRLC
jgi:hypothetical protein